MNNVTIDQGQEQEEMDVTGCSNREEADAVGDMGDALGHSSRNVPSKVARMPVERDAIYYNMGHKRRGLAVIFNHEEFHISSLKCRSGTNVDRDNLLQCLTNLGFKVLVHNNLTVRELMNEVEKAAEEDHTDADCFLMAVLSHGEMGMLYAKDAPYKPDNLWHLFTADKCPKLAGKPKLFIIQACQGDQLDGGITLTRTEVDGGPLSYKIPVHADFLIAYSTVPGFFSWRNTSRGSWFIQALCEELCVNGRKVDILTLFTFVCRRVALDFESCVPNDNIMNRQKQIPCVTTMLTRLLHFSGK